MKAYERLLNYVKVPTPSDERSGTHPSSACQRVLAEQLVKEMKKLGVSDVRIDEKCYVYGKIPATKAASLASGSDAVILKHPHQAHPSQNAPAHTLPALRRLRSHPDTLLL